MKIRAKILTLALLAAIWSSPAHAIHHSIRELCLLSLGKILKQSSTEVADLYKEAGLAKPTFDGAMTHAAGSVGAAYEPSALKQPDRLQAKAAGRQQGEAARILDILRGSIVAETMEGVTRALEAVQKISEHYGFQIERSADYFSNPKENGYRGIRLNIRVPYFGPEGHRGTHVGELQIHHRKLYELKKTKADPLYRRIRAIEESSPHQGLNAGQPAELGELKAQHRHLYEAAWAEIVKQENLTQP